MSLRDDAKIIYESAISASMPDIAVNAALEQFHLPKGKLILISVGKAGWQMAKAAHDFLGESVDFGVVITKYGHSNGEIGNLEIYEAAHPVPDNNGILATKRALDITSELSDKDAVVFLLSGGGSALFEYIDFPLSDLKALTEELLSAGASIVEINTVRKRLSAVKGGRFAKHCYPARIYAIVLSDIISSRLDMVGSGPTVPDSSTCDEAIAIVRKYDLTLTEKQKELVMQKSVKTLSNVYHTVSGSVREFCLAAKRAAVSLGYESYIMTDCMDIEARGAGEIIGSIAASLAVKRRRAPIALIFGGETVVRLKGNGLGGRNQELALAAAKYISGMDDVAVFSVSSDGTDGPTDAAGGYVDGKTYDLIPNCEYMLANNDSYNALKMSGGLIFTGPTGTNVNDFTAILIK